MPEETNQKHSFLNLIALWARAGKKTKIGILTALLGSGAFGLWEPVCNLLEGTYNVYMTLDSAYMAMGDMNVIKRAYARDTIRIKEAIERIEGRVDSVHDKMIEVGLVETYCKSITEVLKGELDGQLYHGIYFLVDNYGNYWYYRDGWLFRAEFDWASAGYYYNDFTDNDKRKRCR